MEPTLNERIASTIVQRRTEAGMSRAALSTRSGLPLRTLARRESGETPWTLDELAAIASALGCPVSDLGVTATAPDTSGA